MMTGADMRFVPVLIAAAVVLSPARAPAADAAPMGDVNVPADHGLTTTLPDGVAVTFEAGTVARWQGAGKLASETAKWTRGFHLELTEGEIEVTVPSSAKEQHAFLLTTRAGTITDWRGRIHVTVHGDVTALAVYEGALVVGSNRQSFPVSDHTAILLHKGAEADKTHSLPAVPAWDASASPPSFAVAPEGTAAGVGVAWTPVAGAASYRLLLATDPRMTNLVQRSSVGDPRFTAPEPGPGVRYFAQVRAVGADGLLGEWSPPRAMRVLRYRLPTGAFVARDGVMVLPNGSSVDLLDADGVDIAYENLHPGAPPLAAASLYWSKVNGPLRLLEDAPLRIAHLRDASLGAEGRVALARREVRADVSLSPKIARASDPIDVRVVLLDPTGRVDVASESVSLQALADLDPVAVTWQRAGNVWTGRIGPRRDTGPSVVRVVANDSLGREIGRGFVEIGSAGARSR
jgi:hypothetical protein